MTEPAKDDLVERLRDQRWGPRPSWTEAADEIERLRAEVASLRAQAESASNSDLTKLAAELHRSKWQFDLSEDYQPSKAAARGLIAKAFDELHRIGDMAMTMRDQSKPLRSPPKNADFCQCCQRHLFPSTEQLEAE